MLLNPTERVVRQFAQQDALKLLLIRNNKVAVLLLVELDPYHSKGAGPHGACAGVLPHAGRQRDTMPAPL